MNLDPSSNQECAHMDVEGIQITWAWQRVLVVSKRYGRNHLRESKVSHFGNNPQPTIFGRLGMLCLSAELMSIVGRQDLALN